MRLRKGIGAAIAIGVAACTAPLVAAAPASATTGNAEVSVVHGIPNTPVDVYVDGKRVLHDFKFGSVAGPLSLHPGKYSVAIRPDNASSKSKPILSATVKLWSGENATLTANLTATGSPALNAFVNPTSAVPAGKARVIVRHVAEAPGVDVYAGSTKVITDLTNPHQAQLVIPAGSVSVSVNVTGTTTTVIGPATFKFKSKTTTIVYAIGSAAAKSLTVAVQTY